MTLPIHIISTPTLEDWTHETPWTTGIGGSEQAHIELVERLIRDYEVWSWYPGGTNSPLFHRSSKDVDLGAIGPAIIINFRNPKLFEVEKPPGQVWWFVAQDVGYAWTPEALARVDRFICLCGHHVAYTLKVHPELKGRIYQSTNGVRSEYIRDFEDMGIHESMRKSHRMLYASSPDRGLLLILENWWRIRERVLDAELHIAYGFENMKTVAAFNGPSDVRHVLRAELERLMKQPGVTFLGRLPLKALYLEWFETGVWFYPHDFRETSCITALDAQACGAWPVTNRLWAVGENVQFGWLCDGIPQTSDLNRSLILSQLFEALEAPDDSAARREMMEWARESYDWDRVVRQYEAWITEDSARGQTKSL